MTDSLMATARHVVLRAEGLAKSFGPTTALRRATFELRAGEVHALIGENGSGKSTLVKILAGVHRPDAGQLNLGQARLQARSPSAAIRSGIATVFQEVQCVPAQSVLDNLWLGQDGLLRRAPIAPAERRDKAAQVLEDLLGTSLDLAVLAGSLSLSQRQALAIGRALLRDPQILILDEATSALDVATRDRLFTKLGQLTAAGKAVLFISHRMDEVTEIADRITVLRSGESVATLERADATPTRLVELMTGGDHLVQPDAARRPEPGPIVIGALALRKGEIVGLAGLEGQGQDEFLRALAQHQNVRTAYVARDRRDESIFPPLSVRENFTAATLTRDRKAGLIGGSQAAARFAPYRDRLKIRLGRDKDPITTLSGGNQQKVVIARALAADPQVLLLNDPTRGIDIGAKRDIYALLRELAATGLAIVMLSTEVDEHLELMDRVIIFRDGEPAAELPGTELTRSAIVSEFFATGAPRPEPAPSRAPLNGSSYTFLPVLLTLLLLIANVAAQHSFLNWSSVIVTFAELATPALAAMASTPAILGGGIDISIAPLFTLVSVVIEVMLLGHGVTNPALVIAVAIGFGAALGALNGALVNYGRFQAVVATLCMTFILSGVALGYAPAPVSGTTGWLTSLGTTEAGIPGGLILIAVPLAAWYALHRTPFVRTLRAVGGSETTAYTAGVNVAAVRTLAYALGGAIAGLAAIAIVAQLHQAEADSAFVTPFILMAIAAVALGGTSLAGGRGGLIASVFGACVIFLIQNLLGAVGVSSFWSEFCYGAILIAAVLFAARTANKQKVKNSSGSSFAGPWIAARKASR
ncbi:MAG TPA: ATP-binding cassette domain-containing protein [Streptosporangiaceae bacterium]|jgi:ABC-type sugar transport system ATPase subunit/ribose/xylose/arabinose/galactoside ABC-type transport system permease subunit